MTARQLRNAQRQASIIAQDAQMAKEKGQYERSLELYQKAYGWEKIVATGYLKMERVEPTRSIVLKSAACLAKECGLFREAEKWLSHALSGNPPEEIAVELRDLFKEINKKKNRVNGSAKIVNGSAKSVNGQLHEVEGVLGMIDATKNRIGIDAAVGRVKINFNPEMHETIVTLIEDPVKATYRITNKQKWLTQIKKAG